MKNRRNGFAQLGQQSSFQRTDKSLCDCRHEKGCGSAAFYTGIVSKIIPEKK
jgi:hypothetical protein